MTFISFFEALETKTNDEIIKMLNENSQFINLRKEDGDTPLHIAARHGNVKLVSEFLKRGAELSASNNNNETPLKIAITNGWNRCVDVINQHIKNTMNQTFRLLSRRANNNRLQTPPFMLENNNDFKPTEPSFSLKDKISSSNIPDDYKKYAIDKEKGLLLNFGPSASKDKEWIETLLKVPFDNYSNLPVNKATSIVDIKEYFKGVNEKLEEASYGMENVKEEVIDYISQMISTNGNAMPRVICIQGNKGVGKTNIVRNGISKVLNRPFQQINMGGITDADYLIGHDSTYVGSKPGRIIQALINSKVMNPIIFMDEVDKISSTEKGNDIQSVLIHLTDPVQNKDFQDKYFIGLI